MYQDPAWKGVDKTTEFFLWYKNHLREMLNDEQKCLRIMRIEREYENSGMTYFHQEPKTDEEIIQEKADKLVTNIQKLGYSVEITNCL